MARNTSRGARAPRNTAPMWKKLAVVLSAPVAVVILVTLLNASKWPQLLFVAFVILVAAAADLGHGQAVGRAPEPRQLGLTH